MTNNKTIDALQRELEESERRYKRLLEASFEGIAIHIDSIIIEANEAFAELTGYTREELVGLNAWTLFPQESHQILIEKLKQSAEEPYEVIAQDKQLNPFPIEIRGKNFEIDGKLARVVAVRDVSQLKAVERELRRAKTELEQRVEELHKSEHQYRTLVETTPHGIQEIDTCGNILFSNEAFCKMSGYSFEELNKMNVADTVLKEDRKKIMDDIARLVAEKPDPFPYFNKSITKDGRTLELEVNWNYKRNETGDVVGFISIITDITARRRIERALEKSHDELEQQVEQRTTELLRAKDEAVKANVAKTKFLATASHDLRQPLQAAHLFLEVLASKEHQPESREIISHLGTSMEALNNLLDSLLDISRLEAGLVEPQLQAVPLAELMRRLAEEYAHIAKDAGVEIRSVTTSLIAYSDPVLLETVLRNLLSNAVKNTRDGKILLGCRRYGDNISVEVWDNGCGIPEDRMGDIFGEFVQVGNEGRDRSKGLGLGLSIVDRLARLLGHRINARSWEGNGSAFTIELPLAPNTPVSEASKGAPVETPKAVSVFIIDDEPAILTSLSMVLEQRGYEIYASSGDGCDECKKFTSHLTAPPDIILADYRLQNGNTGIKAINCLRKTFKQNIPAVLLTGDTAPDRLTEAKCSGLPILHKPINVENLLQALESAIKAE